VCGAQQDNSTACVGSQAQPGAGEGSLPPIFYAVGGGESGYIAPDPNDLNVFYAGSYGGFLSRLDRENGQQRAVNIYPNNPMGYSAIDIEERFQWTFPIVFSPVDGKTLYASSQYLWRTTNGGQSWEKISPNLARSDPKTLQASGGPITKDQTGVETYAVIFTIAPSRQEHTIWTALMMAIHTRDGGKTWEKVTPPDCRLHLSAPHEASCTRTAWPTWPATGINSATAGRTSTRRPTSERPGRRSWPASPRTISRAPSART
jgi:hypothetical protein